MEEVRRAGSVMEQSLYGPRDELDPRAAVLQLQAQLSGEREATHAELARMTARQEGVDRLVDQLVRQADALHAAQTALAQRAPAREPRLLLGAAALALLLAVAALVLALAR
jgi:hypothetical protein